MADELEAAVERIRRIEAGERHRDVYGFRDEVMDDFNYRMLENAYSADYRRLALEYLKQLNSEEESDDAPEICGPQEVVRGGPGDAIGGPGAHPRN